MIPSVFSDPFVVLVLFAVFSFVGWVIEMAYRSVEHWRFVNAGFLYGPVVPIYGFGGLAVVWLDYAFGPTNLLVKMLAFTVVLTALEYVAGFLSERIFGLRLWDYSKNRFNLQGRVCLLFSILWGVLAVFHAQVLFPAVLGMVQQLSPQWLRVASALILVAFAVDLVFSVVALRSFRTAIASSKVRISASLRRIADAFPYARQKLVTGLIRKNGQSISSLIRMYHDRWVTVWQRHRPLDEEYESIVSDILQNDTFLRLKSFRHHTSSIFEHVQVVSYIAYRVCKRLGVDYRSAARGGLLHDFFLYDWHNHDLPELAKDKNHGWEHPKIALRNAARYFSLNAIERDIILRHMWPFTLVPPQYVESYAVCLVDKYVTTKEYLFPRWASRHRIVREKRGIQQLQALSDGNPALESEAVDRAKAGSRSLVKKRPRVKLITIPWSYDVPTLSLASLAAVTPKEMEVSLVDVLRQRLILDEPVNLVGISASTPSIKAAYELADFYRARGAVVVIGGHHATAMPEEALQHADAVVCGEGETSWARICDQFLTNPARVGGIYRDPAPDLSVLPQPRTDLMCLERYSRYAYPVTATRGCPHRCSFCFSRYMSPTYHKFPIAHVLEQVRRRPPFVRGMYFVDDNLVGDVDYTRELFRALKHERIPFVMQARIEVASDPEMLRLAHEAGCIAISTGYESISQMSLNRVGKQADASTYKEASRAIFEAGMAPSSNWVLGFDWDGPDCFDQTLAFLDDSWVLDAAFTTEIPFPGTPAFKRYEREGRILTYDYDEYVGKDHVVIRPKEMMPEQLRDGIRRLAKEFYSVRRIRSRLRRVKSNPLILDAFPISQRNRVALFVGMYQAYHWHELMIPPLRRFANGIKRTNVLLRHRDAILRSNFDQAPTGTDG
ncbi:MAG: cobalamin-dependent protein [Deltaproteobacteria bacterium]|nr:cobalamin-dependent protein [Deltaproteobacteria bacterium]